MAERVQVSVKKPEANRENRTSQIQKTCSSISSPIEQIQFLQRTIGNQAIQRLIKSGTIKAKLRIGQPGDVYEQEADRVAEQATSMPAPVSGQPSIQWAGGEEEIQTKPLTASITPAIQPQADGSFEIGNELESSLVANKGTSSPLPEHVRAYFEPRFGVDFSQVRAHSDSRAAETALAMNARAFTLGNDIVFGAGQYAPETSDGKRLLAHELTHVVQQKGMHAFQRKIAVEKDSIDLSSYFTMIGVSGFTKSGAIYSHPGATGKTLDSEILHAMLYSNRTFNVQGATELEAQKNLDDNVTARKGIVEFAAKKQYAFGAGSAMKMNPAFWEKVGDKWKVKSGVNQADAFKDLNINPQEYAIACQAATQITMIAGSGNSPMKRDSGVIDSDWVPGDWGYIKNMKFTGNPSDVGLEGENLIYVGYQNFWGHFTGTNTYRILQQWFDQVKSWNGDAKILDHRDRPARGLL